MSLISLNCFSLDKIGFVPIKLCYLESAGFSDVSTCSHTVVFDTKFLMAIMCY